MAKNKAKTKAETAQEAAVDAIATFLKEKGSTLKEDEEADLRDTGTFVLRTDWASEFSARCKRTNAPFRVQTQTKKGSCGIGLVRISSLEEAAPTGEIETPTSFKKRYQVWEPSEVAQLQQTFAELSNGTARPKEPTTQVEKLERELDLIMIARLALDHREGPEVAKREKALRKEIAKLRKSA